jgi:nitric oxide reductase large subunit
MSSTSVAHNLLENNQFKDKIINQKNNIIIINQIIITLFIILVIYWFYTNKIDHEKDDKLLLYIANKV